MFATVKEGRQADISGGSNKNGREQDQGGYLIEFQKNQWRLPSTNCVGSLVWLYLVLMSVAVRWLGS